MGLEIALQVENFQSDMLVLSSLAGQGYQLMAVTGIFSGQLFNFLVGFSLSCFVKTIYVAPNARIELFANKDKKSIWMSAIVFGAAFINLLYLFFKITKVNK